MPQNELQTLLDKVRELIQKAEGQSADRAFWTYINASAEFKKLDSRITLGRGLPDDWK